MKDLNYPAKPLFQNESDIDVTIHSDEESDIEDYHINRKENSALFLRHIEIIACYEARNKVLNMYEQLLQLEEVMRLCSSAGENQ